MSRVRVNRNNSLKPDNYYSIAEIMKVIGISRKTVYNYFSYGLPYIIINGHRCVHDVKLSEFLKENTGKTLEEWKVSDETN